MSKIELSPNQIYVLKLLLHSRGLTHKQIINCFYGHLGEEFSNRQNGNVYNLLKRLIKRGLIIRERAGKQMKQKLQEGYFYMLSEDGLEYIENKFGLQMHHRASGFDDEYNSMPYDLYKTTIASARNAQVEHTFYNKEIFSMVAVLNNASELEKEFANIRSNEKEKFKYHDIINDPKQMRELTPIKNRILKDTRPSNYLTYRNNLYCAPPKGEVAYKPDAELEVDGIRYAIEVDMGTERGDHLNEKFIKLNERLNELKSKGSNILKGVIFILKTKGDYSTLTKPNHHIISRFRSIHETFKKTNLEHMDMLQLNVVLINDFQKFIPSLTDQSYTKARLDFQAALVKETQNEIVWKAVETTERFYFTSYKAQFYLYAIIEGSNSKTWHDLMATHTMVIDNLEQSKGVKPVIKVIVIYKNIVPIFPYHPNNLKGVEQEFYNNVHLVQIRNAGLNWFSADYHPTDSPFSEERLT